MSLLLPLQPSCFQRQSVQAPPHTTQPAHCLSRSYVIGVDEIYLNRLPQFLSICRFKMAEGIMRGLVHPPRRLPIRISLLVILVGLFGQEHVQAQDIFSFSSNNSRETCQQWLEFQKSVRGATTLLSIQEYHRAIAPGRNPPWINCVNACADAEHKDPNRLWCARARIANNPPPSASFGPGSDQFNTNTDATNAGPNTPVMGNATTNADSGPVSITD